MNLNEQEAPVPAPQQRSPAAWAAGILIALLAVSVISLGGWGSYRAEHRNDQYQLLLLGQVLRDGGTLYVDAWENKPPGIAWINRFGLWLSGGGQMGAWVLPGILAVLSVGMLGWTMKRLLSPVAATTTVLLAALAYSLRVYDTPSINPDFYSSILELAAGSLFFTAAYALAPELRVPLSVLAGLLWAGAACVKPTGIAGLLAISPVAFVLGRIRRHDENRWFAAAGATWASFLVTSALVALVLIIQGTFGAAVHAVISSNRELLGWRHLFGAACSWGRAYNGLAPVLLPLWLGLVGVAASLRIRGANAMSAGLVVALLLWWVLQVWLALCGPSGSMRYWQATFPPMLWLAGLGVYHLEAVFRQLTTGRRTFVIATATIVALLGGPGFDHWTWGLGESYLASQKQPTERQDLMELGEAVGKLAPPQEPIYVWAYDSAVYVFAQRRPASRFTYPRSEEQLEQILKDLRANHPSVLLVPDDSPEFKRWCDDPCYHSLNSLLMEEYEMRGTVGRYRLWVRGSAAAAVGTSSGSG